MKSFRAMKSTRLCLGLAALCLVAGSTWQAEAKRQLPKEALYHGTAFVCPGLITTSDPSSFVALIPKGQAERKMFDRRLDNWKVYNAFIFEATYRDSEPIEIQVNPEFIRAQATVEAGKYARAIGQLPALLRADVKTCWIHQGKELFGGRNQNILIHTGQSVEYERDGVLEEVLLHEATHTSLDAQHATAKDWQAAQTKDPAWLSVYGKENPEREDLAETYPLYLAFRYRPQRLPRDLKEQIQRSVPARLVYLDTIKGPLTPFVLK